jgi:precorrin-6Y C5,15-methyltransferase (decarboxylating)
VRVLGAEHVVIHPNLTAIQTACARLRIPWQDAVVVSLHGRSWEHLAAVLGQPGPWLIYTDPAHPPGEIARFLLDRGLSSARFCVLEDLGQGTERITWMSLARPRKVNFRPCFWSWCCLRRAGPPAATLHLGLPEAALDHQAGLITKAEVRAVVLAKLKLLPGQVLWDVGAGCGSVGLEASLLIPGGKIFAVERHPERAAQIAANRDHFGVDNLEVVCAPAPVGLAQLPDPHRVFVGGGGPEIGAIIQEAVRRLAPGGRVVVTAALLETLETARTVLEAAGWEVEVVQVQVSCPTPGRGTACRP